MLRKTRQTVARGLVRSQGCRYGIHGLAVQVIDSPGIYKVLFSERAPTDGEYDHLLTLIPEAAFDAYCDRQPRMMTAAELMAWKPDYPAGSLVDVTADQCALISAWPEVCACWKGGDSQ